MVVWSMNKQEGSRLVQKMHKLLLYITWVEARVMNTRAMTNSWEDLRLKENLMRKANDFIVVMNAI